jgi:ABC-2 type transport system permease protein
MALITFAFIWLAVALGMVSESVETASNLPMPLVHLPFLSSGFVPTDSMPALLRFVRRVSALHPNDRDPERIASGRSDQ